MVKSSISVKIVLPGDASMIKSTQVATIWHCGDEIHGHLEVVTYGTFGLTIEVAFEGLVRTWIGSDIGRNPYNLPPTGELQFLKESQQVFSNPSPRFDSGQFYVRRLPFRFVIPHELISPRSDVHPNFLKLCPSAKLGLPFWGPTNGQTYRQPTITYVIKVTRIWTGVIVAVPVKSIAEREIIVMPYTSAAPPLEMEHFPRDYRSFSTKSLKPHRWGRSLGTVKISALEPSPLNIYTSAPRPATTVALKLVFISLYPHGFGITPCEWKYTVKCHLRSRTFYSTKMLDRIPTSTTARGNQFLEVQEKKICSETREFGTIPWERDCETRSSDLDIGYHNAEFCIWTTDLVVPVSAKKTLLPTFLNQLSARLYSIVIQLSIKGLSHGPIELILPVQVIFYPPQGILGGMHEEDRVESQDETVSPAARLLHQFTTVEVDGRYDHLQAQANPPPSYDI